MFASQMGRFRPIPELANHRTPIENIYHGSGATHFGGGIGRSGSYNCYKVIAEDLGLRKIWEEQGRPF
jgi:beta-carotene ketolase (CrtO type)